MKYYLFTEYRKIPALSSGCAGWKEENMVYFILAMLGAGCAYLGLGLLVDRLLAQPVERRWRR